MLIGSSRCFFKQASGEILDLKQQMKADESDKKPSNRAVLPTSSQFFTVGSVQIPS